MPTISVVLRPQGLYCPAGDFYIDPWRPVERRRARPTRIRTTPGAARPTTWPTPTARARCATGWAHDITLQTLAYGEAITHQGVTVSLHPAGHVLGSAQVRIEHAGQVWVASGDYKLEDDGTCPPFEPVRCHTFITESTFGLPIYRWPAQPVLFADINAWWAANAAAGKASVLYAYAFGKAQRLLHGVDSSIGPIVVHGAVEPLNAVYRAAGVPLPPTHRVTDPQLTKADLRRALVMAPPSAAGTPWLKRFRRTLRRICQRLDVGARRAPPPGRGPGLCDERPTPTGPACKRPLAPRGRSASSSRTAAPDVMVRWLCEQGLDAQVFATEYGGDDHDDNPSTAAEEPASAPTSEAAP